MKFFAVIFATFLVGLVSADGGNTNCAPNQCLCEVSRNAGIQSDNFSNVKCTIQTIFGRNAGDHEGTVFTCQDNPNNKDCLKICG
jgi:hypothetical protein